MYLIELSSCEDDCLFYCWRFGSCITIEIDFEQSEFFVTFISSNNTLALVKRILNVISEFFDDDDA